MPRREQILMGDVSMLGMPDYLVQIRMDAAVKAGVAHLRRSPSSSTS
jgi:hypothetical protein